MLVGRSVTVFPETAVLVGTTSAGGAHFAPENIGVTYFPPMTARIGSGAIPVRGSVGAALGATGAPAARVPASFNWMKPADCAARVREKHGASAPVLPWYVLDAPNQLQCGSCWAFSASGVLGDRERFERNAETPPLSVSFTLACGAVSVTEGAGGGGANPCGGGQVSDAVALATTLGIPGWLSDDYSWANTGHAPSEGGGGSFGDLGAIGQCLQRATVVGVTASRKQTPDQARAEREAEQSVSAASDYIRQHAHPRSSAPGTAASYEFSGLPADAHGVRAATASKVPAVPVPTFARADSFYLLQDFAAVQAAVYQRGPVVGMYFVPGDFMTGWKLGTQAWRETCGVYAHSLDVPLYGTADSRATEVRQLLPSAAGRFTGDPQNAIAPLPPSGPPGGPRGIVTGAAVAAVATGAATGGPLSSPAQLSMGGHAVAVVGYALLDLWGAGAGTPPPLQLSATAAATALRIRPTEGSEFAQLYGTASPVYTVRNSWAAQGPVVDGKAGVWQMLASGRYDVWAGTKVVATDVALGRNTGFDEPVLLPGPNQRFGGILEFDVDLAHSPTPTAGIRMAALQANPDCGCAVGAVVAPGPDRSGACPASMTAAGWCFFALTLALLTLAVVLAGLSAGRRLDFRRGR